MFEQIYRYPIERLRSSPFETSPRVPSSHSGNLIGLESRCSAFCLRQLTEITI